MAGSVSTLADWFRQRFVDRLAEPFESSQRQRLIIGFFAAVEDLPVDLFGAVGFARPFPRCALASKAPRCRSCQCALVRQRLEGRQRCCQSPLAVIQPGEAPDGVVAHAALGELFLTLWYRAGSLRAFCRNTHEYRRRRNWRGRQKRCRDIAARFEIVERLAVFMAIPQHLADLVERFRGFAAVRKVAGDLFEQRNRVSSAADRRQLGEIEQPLVSISDVVQNFFVERFGIAQLAFARQAVGFFG